MRKLTNKKSEQNINVVLPGIVICVVVMVIGIYGAEMIGFFLAKIGLLSSDSKTPVSGIFVAIIIGIIIRNFIGLNNQFQAGISFSTRYILRAGIVLLGLRLSLIEALRLGAIGIPLIVICIALGLFLTLYLTRKMKQSQSLGTLIACGTGICGVTAIMTISPVIKAKDDEVSYAVANVTIFGLTAMILYPFLAHVFFVDDPVKIGLFLGTAIHDTSQVTGAALIYSQIYDMETVINVATVTKLTRNLFIIIIVPFVSYLYYRSIKNSQEDHTGKTGELPRWYTFIPGFVIAFLLFALIRTIGDMTIDNFGLAFGIVKQGAWETLHSRMSSFGTSYLLGIAMAGVGLSTEFSKFKGIGVKPFYIGFIAAISIGFASITLISLFGHLITV